MQSRLEVNYSGHLELFLEPFTSNQSLLASWYYKYCCLFLFEITVFLPYTEISMALDLVGGAFLSATLNVLFERLASRSVLDFIRGRKFSDSLLKKLKIKLLAVNFVLNDAEEKQITDPLVKAWLDELKDAVYVADDLLDEIATEALRCKLEAGSDASSVQVWNANYTSVNSFDEGMQSRIEEILDRLEYSLQQKDVLGLKQVVGVGKPSQRLPTTSLAVESIVYGRDHDKEKVIEFLLSDTDASSGHEIGVFTIVGMGGLGKTTLAQLVYNDGKVEDFFHLKAWVCVSEEFDVIRVTKTILEAINPSACASNDLNLLQVRLKDSLSDKKFLLILDDVWNENSNDWDTLRAPFRFGAKGSKIIVTTRSEIVATIMGSVPTYKLNKLLDEDCWSLFANRAFENISNKFQELEVIGRKIVKKCNGLPLAAKTLGGLLRSKADVADWSRILKSKLWDHKSDILPALRLSYHYLPSHLKCCFAYCSIFPKDYEFEKQQLVLLWMAQDFLHDPHGNKQMEEVGNEYIDNLISRSFFQQSSKDKSCFVMHDLVNDLAKYVSGEFCFRLEDEILSTIPEKARHFSYSINKFDASRKFKALNIAKNLHTFLPLDGSGVVPIHKYVYLADCVPQDILPAQSFLRVLSLSHYRNIRELPNSLGGLNHLRYLDLSYTAIQKLPDSTSNLCNLQTLLLHDCPDLTKLPQNMGNLIKLRHLDVSGTKLKEVPMHMSKLTNLQTLSAFIVGEHEGSKIKELRDLNDLHGRLEILNLENVVNARDAQEGNLKEKVHIEELRLHWSKEADNSQNARDVLDKLQPQTKLKKLTIERYGGTRFPDWLGGESFSNMVFLCLSNCKYCLNLPPVGRLPSLQELFIDGFDEVVKIGSEFYGRDTCAVVNNKPFEFLKKLRIENMPELEEWCCSADEGAEFGCLKELGIVNCPKLKGVLPDHLPFVKTLELENCGKLELFSGNGVVDNVPKLDSWPRLEQLEISNMSDLKELPPGLMLSLPAIKKLIIRNCLSLESLPMSDLSTTLESLEIFLCPKLDLLLPEEEADDDEEEIQQMAHYNSDASLQYLTILHSCDPLASFPLGLFPKLRSLNFMGCRHLKSLWIPKGGGVHGDNHPLSSLFWLCIDYCPKFESFPKGGLPTPKLTMFSVHNCESLKSLPERMYDLLPSLHFLSVFECPELESFPEEGAGGLPTIHTSLIIRNCAKLTDRRTEWGLQKRFPNLHSFHISAGVVVEESSFPEEWLLPSSLTSLSISTLPNLKYLNHRGIQHLTSLQELKILNCSKLQCLPEEGLPHSLSLLEIDECPQLEKWCEREKGQGWPKIAHIPNILINHKLIS